MKKMRRLIPAFAMLLIAATMLSTASFAWFTMSTNVTASGMQIQAQADSSLVISREPLTYNSGLASVDFAAPVKKLVPMTYGEYTATGATTATKGWVVPTNTAGINSTTGAMVAGDVYKSANATAGTNYVEESIYIASAGAEMTDKQLTITLTAPVIATGSASKAYAAAIYVVTDKTSAAWQKTGTVGVDAEPDAIIYVDQAVTDEDTDGRHKVTLATKYTIPSIVGVGEQNDQTTGIKVIIRFFVDGNLESVGDDMDTITTGYTYTAATGTYYETTMYYVENYVQVENSKAADIAKYFIKSENNTYVAATNYSADETYYTKEYKPAVASPDMVSGTSTVPTGWFTRSAVTERTNYKYIRTDDVPTAASQLEIKFSTDGN